MTVILITVKEPCTLVHLPTEIIASQVSIVSSYNAPVEFILLTSDIAQSQIFDSNLKQIIGHIPSAIDCFRPLLRTNFSSFYVNLEDSTGKAYTPTKGFIIELCFK